jgi:outer membrane protein assembly factor BamB
MNKKWIILASIIAILIISVPLGWILIQENFAPENENTDIPSVPDNPTSSEPEEPELATILWQNNIENFATSLGASKGNIYTIDTFGNIVCYDARTGDSVWKENIGGYWAEGLVIYEDKVYGGTGSAIVGCLDKRTGRLLWDLAGIPHIKYSKQAPENITVVDDRVFLTTNAFNAFNATTGKQLWLIDEFGPIPGQSDTIWGFNGWAFENNLLIGTSGGPEGKYIYRLYPENGTLMWAIEGMFVDSPAVYKEQIVVQNVSKTEIFSLDESSGDLLWSYDVGATICNTREYNSLLLFGASDDSFYALNLDNGTLAWKSSVNSQNITSLVNNDNPLESLPVLIDEQNQRMIGILAVTTQTNTDDNRVEDIHYGILCSLDLKTGNVIWTEYFSGEGDISNEYLVFDYASSENNIYLTAINDLLIFSKKTGNLIESQHFEHQITPPVTENGKVFVAADLWLFAYD